MDEDIEKIFPSDEPTEETVETTEEADTPVEETTEETTEAAPEVEAEEAPVEAPKPQEQRQHGIPVEALLEERAKRQEAERLRLEMEQRLREIEAQKAQQNVPDPFDNPGEYTSFLKQELRKELQQEFAAREIQAKQAVFNESYQRAVQAHGEETAKAALQWAESRARTDVQWGHQMMAQSDPAGWIVEQQNRHALIEEIARDPEGYVARKLAEQGMEAAPAASTIQPQAEAIKAPKSIASKGSSNAAKPSVETEKEWMDGLFNSKR